MCCRLPLWSDLFTYTLLFVESFSMDGCLFLRCTIFIDLLCLGHHIFRVSCTFVTFSHQVFCSESCSRAVGVYLFLHSAGQVLIPAVPNASPPAKRPIPFTAFLVKIHFPTSRCRNIVFSVLLFRTFPPRFSARNYLRL